MGRRCRLQSIFGHVEGELSPPDEPEMRRGCLVTGSAKKYITTPEYRLRYYHMGRAGPGDRYASSKFIFIVTFRSVGSFICLPSLIKANSVRRLDNKTKSYVAQTFSLTVTHYSMANIKKFPNIVCSIFSCRLLN